MRQGSRLRVLMAHWDGSGNIPPQRALARELTRRGHDVHVLSHDTLAAAVIADGGRFRALPSAPQWNPAQPRTGEEEGAFVVHMDMLGDAALRAASRSFASGVSRFGQLTRAADLIERAVLRVTGV